MSVVLSTLSFGVMSVVRFAFVGCGGIARHHLRAVQECGHASQVAAVVDTRINNAEQFLQLLPGTQQKQCQIFSSLPELLSWGRFDAAVLMVPHHLHESYASACLQDNKHVLLEKPLAHSLPSALALLEQAKKSTTVFMVAEQSPHWPEVERAGQLLESGVIGRAYHALANYWEAVGFTTFLDEAHFFAGGNWRFDPEKAGGGLLMDGATHWVRPLTIWFGDIEEVVGMVDYPLKESRCESLGHALLRFSSGNTASLYTHFNRIPMTTLPFFQIFGEQGEITINGSFDGGMSYRNRAQPNAVDIPSLGGFSAAFLPQMKEFVEKIVRGQVESTNAEKALQEVMVAQATYKSIRTKQWEKVTSENLTS